MSVFVFQLWMVTSYIVDGFADVGTMVGARLLGAGERPPMRRLTLRLAMLGAVTGLAAAALLAALYTPLVRAFTRDAATTALLATVWPLLCALQPINALVFVYDGLLYATRSFSFVRNALLLGVLLIFAPALTVCRIEAPDSLLAIWGAKAALNAWRCLSALWRIHAQLWRTWVDASISEAA